MTRLVTMLVGAALVLAACGTVRPPSAETAPLTVVLFDVSRSTNHPVIRARYAEAFDEVLDGALGVHGTVIGDVIDDNPLAHSTYPIDVTFTACDPLSENRFTCEARLAEQRDLARETARRILSGPAGPAGTDIRAGVQLAGRVFAAYPDATPRSLVVLSDMAEHAAARADETPSLPGVRVYVVGAGMSAGGAKPADRILATEQTWLTYFAASGADLTPERYGAALVRFP
jgi:hypothetical protein